MKTALPTVLLACCLLFNVSWAFGTDEQQDVSLVTCPVSSVHDLNALRQLEAEGRPIDIFEEKIPLGENTFVHILTNGATARFLLSRRGCYEQKSSVTVKRLLSSNVDANAKEVTGDGFFDNYRSYDNINSQLRFYRNSYPNLVKLVTSAGHSYEGRELTVMHITAAELGQKPLIWVMAGQHAREWIATAATMHVIDSLLKGYNQSATITNLLENYEIAIMPLVNPDGYEYSRTRNRLWRKNRSRPYGADLNRNWDHLWCQIGSSHDAKTDIYCGKGPASEPEVHNTQNYILGLANRVIGFDVHSYGQVVLRNNGHTVNLTPIESTTKPMSEDVARAMTSVERKTYKAMLSAGLYPTSGGAEDWMYHRGGIPGFVMEMRDHGEQGFLLEASNIRATGRELLQGILTASKYIKDLKRVHTYPRPDTMEKQSNLLPQTNNDW